MEGDVPLAHFARAVTDFHSLVDALTHEVAPGDRAVRWIINYLEVGSAALGVEGHGAAAASVVDAFEQLSEAAERGQRVPFSQEVQKNVDQLTAVMNGEITKLRFGANEKTFVIAEPRPDRTPAATRPVAVESYGSVTGRIETLVHRSMKVSLYALLDDSRVDCFLARGQEPLVENAWGRLAIVQGLVRRDLRTGAAVSIRQVTAVESFDEPEPGAWRLSAGIAPATPGSPPSEETVRRLRESG